MDETLKIRLLKDPLFVTQVRVMEQNLTYEFRPLFDIDRERARTLAIKLVRAINTDEMWAQSEKEREKQLALLMHG